jgi:hypothetical protein
MLALQLDLLMESVLVDDGINVGIAVEFDDGKRVGNDVG